MTMPKAIASKAGDRTTIRRSATQASKPRLNLDALIASA